MMIFVTGDTHGLKDFGKIVNFLSNNPDLNNKDTKIIITGDFGCFWKKEDADLDNNKMIQFLSKYKCQFLFIDGNNENFDILDSLPVSKIYGGNVHKITENIFHLMRGEIFNIENISFLALGGADSWDAPSKSKYYGRRFEGISWWKRESASLPEFENAVRNLRKNHYKVDVILTHEGTSDVANYKGSNVDAMCRINDYIYRKTNFKYWFCGHHHVDVCVNGVKCLFNDIVKIENMDKVAYFIDKNDSKNLNNLQ